MKFSYVFKSASGDDYHIISKNDYKTVYEFMKNEIPGEYEAWVDEWDDDWGEFDENTIDYEYYDKKAVATKKK